MGDVPWYYVTSGPNRVVLRAKPDRVEKWDRELKKWVPALVRPEAVFSDFKYDAIAPLGAGPS